MYLRILLIRKYTLLGFAIIVSLCAFAGRQYTGVTSTTQPVSAQTQAFLNNTTVLLSEYISLIEKARVTLLSLVTQSNNDCSKVNQPLTVSAHSTRNFFDVLNGLTFVRTIYLRAKLDYFENILAPRYYDFSSNNCEFLDANALGGKGEHGRIWYNVTCHEDVKRAMFSSRPLDPVSLNVGLPIGNHQTADDKLWTFIHVVQNAWVDTNGEVYVCGVTIVPSSCIDKGAYWSKRYHNGRWYDEVFTISQLWGEGFYHSTLENLPRLAPYIGFSSEHPNIKIHVAHKQLMVDLSQTLPGISHRLVTGATRAKLVYSPAGGPCGRSPILTTQLLSLFLRQPFHNIPQSRDKIIVIKRSRKRFFSQHDAIVKMLKQQSSAYGLTVSVFSDNPLPDIHTARSLFNQAILVVAPHGAGEANLLYSQPGTVLVEGLCYDAANNANLCYRNMAHALGMRYHGLIFSTQCTMITAEQIQEPVKIILDNFQYL